MTIIKGAYLGYVLIGILAFILGITVTLLCIHLRRYYDSKR